MKRVIKVVIEVVSSSAYNESKQEQKEQSDKLVKNFKESLSRTPDVIQGWASLKVIDVK